MLKCDLKVRKYVLFRNANDTATARHIKQNARVSDASQYAHYVFSTIKRNPSGKISFEVSVIEMSLNSSPLYWL